MAKLLITTLNGPADATRASIPFHFAANGAAKNGTETAVAIAGDAAELLKPGVADGVRGVGVPPLAELLAGCKAAGVRLYI
ncbi:MAG: DsrE family protein [Candidatus Limnocylindria bacterium]